jgi:hypothetical protein
VSRKSGTGGKGGEARRRGRRNRIGGVGEVGGSPMRLSAAACVEWRRVVMRGRRCHRGRSWKVCKGAPERGGDRGGNGWAEGWPEGAVLGGQRSSGRRQHGARRS